MSEGTLTAEQIGHLRHFDKLSRRLPNDGSLMRRRPGVDRGSRCRRRGRGGAEVVLSIPEAPSERFRELHHGPPLLVCRLVEAGVPGPDEAEPPHRRIPPICRPALSTVVAAGVCLPGDRR